MLRFLQSLFITGFFAVMMFLLFRDHIIPGMQRRAGIAVEHAVLTDSWANKDETHTIQLGDWELGALRTVAEKDEIEDFYVASAHLIIDTRFFRARVLSTARMNHRLEVQNARVRVHVPPPGVPLLDPRVLDGEELPEGAYELLALIEGTNLRVRLRRDDAIQYTQIRLPRPVTVADSLNPIYRGNMLSKGKVYTADIYDPLYGSNGGALEVRYVDDEIWNVPGEGGVPVKKIELRYSSYRMLLWVDDTGRELRREIPLIGGAALGTGETTSERNARVIMDWLDPASVRSQFPDLAYVREDPIEVTRRDVTGEDQGRVLQGFSVFSLVGRSLEGSMGGFPSNSSPESAP